MIKSIILPEENTKITVGKPINDESNTKVIAIYDYREEPEEASLNGFPFFSMT